ncbi:hypothetical protein BO94DRAFT_479377 [Aspergillus sclerotioniger CBS 115572]|uniref:HNH nuclease domain-containing protein n=1 Tax=Aspergillus sclerotioniger CBS 115572 TaxID=1450535 RepID=A0A317V0B1_9EURO|nr:hypothetical protein BO94DRAFT_479377 [Aspergillus sclerotioniger CBS 115572]PWY66811.1 hypothetical protein BO94DRAFT_479377 [Aspergillus sclerotioniger CBS 115572]
MGPADELLDPRRRDLITRLSTIMEIEVIDSIGWACLWFADLSTLEELVTGFERGPLSVSSIISCSLSNTKERAKSIKACKRTAGSNEDLGEPSEDEETETEEPPTKKRRLASDLRKASKRAGKQTAEQALGHHNDTCILTGCTIPVEVAHIFPKSLGKNIEGLRDFWKCLQCFWTPQQVKAWKNRFLGSDGTETCSNLICMVNNAHKLWEKAAFALKPLSLSEDERQLEVQFFWLPKHKYRKQVPLTAVPDPFPRNLSSTNDQYKTVLFNNVTDTKLCSGDILTFKTGDPMGHPLPSMELLNMQWVLHRVLALSGAAYATDEELFPDPYMSFRRATAFGLYEEDSDWDSEMEVDEEEEGEEAEDSQGTPEGEAWE